jgi:hypothetical protein
VLQPHVENLEHMAIPERIKDDLPLPPGTYHVEIPERSKLMGYRRFAHPEKDRQIPDTHLPFPQSQKNADSGGVPQGPEHPGKVMTDLLGGSLCESFFQTLGVKGVSFLPERRMFHNKDLLLDNVCLYEYMLMHAFRQSLGLGFSENIFEIMAVVFFSVLA